MPRNWTERRLSDLGSPPAIAVFARATWAIIQRPWRMLPRQADRVGELRVDVDRVEVAGGPRVAVRQVLVRGHLQLGIESPCFSSCHSDPPDDVGPRSLARPGRRPGSWRRTRRRRSPCRPSRRSPCSSESVVITSPDADRLAPLELLAAVEHRGEVDPDLGIEDRRAHRGGAVDDGEHRRRDDVAEAGRRGGVSVVVDLRSRPDGVRELAHLLAPDLVGRRGPLLADRVGLHRHRRGSLVMPDGRRSQSFARAQGV